MPALTSFEFQRNRILYNKGNTSALYWSFLVRKSLRIIIHSPRKPSTKYILH